MPSPNILAFIVSAFIRTDRLAVKRTDGKTDMARSAKYRDKEHIYFMGSETLPSSCNIFSDECSIPLYSTSNGYKKDDEKRLDK